MHKGNSKQTPIKEFCKLGPWIVVFLVHTGNENK